MSRVPRAGCGADDPDLGGAAGAPGPGRRRLGGARGDDGGAGPPSRGAERQQGAGQARSPHVTLPRAGRGFPAAPPPRAPPRSPPTPPGARETASLLGPKSLRAARPTPEISLLSLPRRGRGVRREAAPARGKGMRGGGVRAAPASFLPPPRTHPEAKSCCTLSSRSRRVSSIAADAAAATAAQGPAGPVLAPRRRPFRVSAPAAPTRAAAVGRAGLGCGKGAGLPSV